LWASHKVHHSSARYNLSTALRQTWTGSFLSFVFWLWLPIVGFAPVMIMTIARASRGRFEYPFANRAHHRSNPR